MKKPCFFPGRRTLALSLVLLLTLQALAPAVSAQEIAPTCDETYYATLDYYGALLESSVVKSYRTYGSERLTDYGLYDQVTNLTDSRGAAVADGQVSFDLSGDVPDKFYFEGKTAQPYEDFPWTLALSYTLNGVPTQAEDLAGKTGLVEITLDAVPNPEASEYSRNNLVLTAMSVFNGDDILSLAAPGAQVQLLGNLYCVLYAVLPGEEQHAAIQVGAEEFAYSGMMFLAVPATLEQLDQVADLRQAKEKAEDSYDAINDSLDVILDTLEGMSGSLNAAASGLDQLNRARGTISGGKGQVYDSLDRALDAAGPLTESMEPLTAHLGTAQQALSDFNGLLNEMNDNVAELPPEVENTRKLIKNLQFDLNRLQELLDDLDDKHTLSDAKWLVQAVSDDFELLGKSMDGLQKTLQSMRSDLSGLEDRVAQLEGSNHQYITINVGGVSMTVKQIESSVLAANGAYSGYGQAVAGGVVPDGTSFYDFLILVGGQSEEEAAATVKLWTAAQTAEFEEQLQQAKQINGLLEQFNLTVNQLKALVGDVSGTASPILTQLSNLCRALGGSELSGDLGRLMEVAGDALGIVEKHDGGVSGVLEDLDAMGSLALRVSENLDTALTQVQELTDMFNTYEPEVQQALTDAQTFTQSASAGMSALVDAAGTTEQLTKESGEQLDQGTKQTLSSLSSALRQSTAGLSQTDTIRNAKDMMDQLIDDEWNSHTGQINNLLLMDAGAQPQSLTDSRNQGTTSIQYIMRSQEIKADEGVAGAVAAAAQADAGTIWTRIADMFRDLWQDFVGLFQR